VIIPFNATVSIYGEWFRQMGLRPRAVRTAVPLRRPRAVRTAVPLRRPRAVRTAAPYVDHVLFVLPSHSADPSQLNTLTDSHPPSPRSPDCLLLTTNCHAVCVLKVNWYLCP
jgi:hypothetical protein